MAYIAGTGIARPPYKFNQSDVKPFIRDMFQDVYPDIDRLMALFENTHIDSRHFCVPMEWFQQTSSFEEKNSLYFEYSIDLGIKALQQCLDDAHVSLDQIKHVFFVSSTGIATPSIDAHILGRVGADAHVKRTPIWGLGCAGGAAGLSRAFEYVKAYPDEAAVVIAVELCGLTFQRNDLTKSNLVATSLFADGAAAVLVAGSESGIKGNLKLNATMSTRWEDTYDVMGWDFSSSGFHVIFSRDIPSLVKTQVADNIQDFLNLHHTEMPSHFIFHPGGQKVLDAYQEALSIPSDKLRIPRQILQENGNMSSCTVLYVLDKYLKEDPLSKGDIGLISSLGPGFSSELLLVEGTE
jgi:alkylresorcinol/alkylpyrone synthase